MTNITQHSVWQQLVQHQKKIARRHMRAMFTLDLDRANRYQAASSGVTLDYSRNHIDDEILSLLCQLANVSKLSDKITELFSGAAINFTEDKPALHTALRDFSGAPLIIQGVDVAAEIAKERIRLRQLVTAIHAGTLTGATGKQYKHIINIGIGGSYTGPMMACYALQEFAKTQLKFHFISSVDDIHVHDILQNIDAESALFIISSKSFTTIETLTNAKTVISWLENKLGASATAQHVIAVTAAVDKAIAWGIAENNIFKIWDWVGGRYSIWSAMGLPVMLMLGNEQFDEFLQGAHTMDQHFRDADFRENLPVLSALLSIWYINFYHSSSQALIPYLHRLKYLIPYLQQADMESNGKRTNYNGIAVCYQTGPIIFGEEGVIGQHAYHQLLHQGQHLIPADFILLHPNTVDSNNHHQQILTASALSQSQALRDGKTLREAEQELRDKFYSEERIKDLAPHQVIPGNKPSNLIYLNRLSPSTLGALLSMYEHKIFVQGVIWNINSFDQWGVELGKQLLPSILAELQNSEVV